jgi:DNA repair exonuclease SbcCD nuclease subunit
MNIDGRDTYMGKLAERVLEIHSFDGRTLTLRYNQVANSHVHDRDRLNENDLVQYAESSMTNLLAAGDQFPGLDKIVVDFGSL